MAYFGRTPKKPQQLGRVEGGVTRSGDPTSGRKQLHPGRQAQVRGHEARQGRTARAAVPSRAGRAGRSAR